jgi:hypothetical protein
MMMRKTLAIAAAAMAASGCGDSGPSLVSVNGAVIYEGKPLEEAVVSFLPDPGSEKGQPGEAITDQQGKFKALTNGRSGLVPGRYKVVVAKSLIDPAAGDANSSSQHQDDPYMLQLMATLPDGSARKKKSKPDRIDAQFDRDVPEEGAEINLDVTPKTAGK